MTRPCTGCLQHQLLREFDLSADRRAASLPSGAYRRECLSLLQRQRRGLIAALTRLDAKIAELRARPSVAATPHPAELSGEFVVVEQGSGD